MEGPDYVALVIEWDDIDDVGEGDTIVREPVRAPGRSLGVATVVGAIGVLVLAAWGVHRLTSA